MINTYSFSKREQDVIGLLLQGKSNKQIAQVLGISTSTVEFHLKNIYTKLQVDTRIEAVVKLSNSQLGKSIGSVITEELRESTVEEMPKSAYSNNNQPTLRRISMKKFAYIIGSLLTTLLIVLFLFANSPAKSIDVIPTAMANTELPITSTIASPTSQIESCIFVHEVTFCVKGTALTKDFTYVMLEIKTPPNIQPDGMGFMLPSALEGEIRPTLRDDLGNEYNTVDDAQSLIVFPGSDNQTYQQTLKFPRLDKDAKFATLKFPSIVTSIPLQSSILLDLGETPQPGQIISLDQTLNLQGQEIHLTGAELSGDGTNSLHIDIWSDPVKFKGDIVALMLNLGIPDGTDMGTGFGSKMILPNLPYHAFAELARPGMQPVSGMITIPVNGISIYYQGDFEIPFSIPESGLYSEITPTLDQSAQIAEIRRFANNPSLDITFITFEYVNNAVWSALYFTKDGSKYWVETQTRRIVQFENGKALENIGAENKNTDEFKSIADQFAIKNSLKFSQLHDDLVLSEKLEGNLHLFRWEYQKITISDVGSPFLQVIVSRDGKVVGYTNTLDFVGQ